MIDVVAKFSMNRASHYPYTIMYMCMAFDV